MKTTQHSLIALVASLFIGLNVHGQIVFDLGDKNTKTETVDIDGEPVIVFKSVISKAEYKYTYEIEMQEKEIPAISVKRFAPDSAESETPEFDKALKAFKEELDEAKMPKLYDKLEKEVNKLDKKKYGDKIQEGREALEASIFSKTLGFKLRNNQEIKVTVTRTGGKTSEGKDTTITWVRTFKTPEKSPWSVMYGFTYVPNLMNPVANYYCTGDSVGGYTITRLNNRNNLFFKNLSPTLMITWTPMTIHRAKGSKGKFLYSNHLWQLGFTAGLSMNFASETGAVTAMAAPSLVIAKNVSLSFGACMTQKQILNGKYKEGDAIQENLDFDQLHEKQFMGEWFFSLAIRFDENPFSKKEDDKKD